MIPRHETLIATLLVAVVAAAPIVGGVGAVTDTGATEARSHAAGESSVSAVQTNEPSASGAPVSQADEPIAASDCAAEPPSDGSAPESDVVGWENGSWYDASLDVNQDDGVQDDEIEAIVARTMARVEAIRCIEFDESVPVSVVSREEFRRNQLERNVSAELRTFDNVKFESLFLINESTDSIEVQNRNRGAGVLGFYSPERDEIVVVAESAETLRIDELTLAHELIHAWQDQRFDLQEDPLNESLRDEVNARSAVVEGDASYVETLYERQCGQGWDCLEGRSADSAGELANIGVYVLKFQPYSDGPAFVRMVRNLGGWDAVDALYDAPPASTEQVIHPQRYRADAPTNVTLEDTASGDWERVRPPNRPDYGSVGESALMAMFIYPYYHSEGQTEVVSPAQWFNQNETGQISQFDPLDYESQYSTGWDGDRLHVYENATGEHAYVWRLAWDSPQDAQQFVEGYQRVLRYWGAEQVGPSTWRIADGGFADAFHVRVDGPTVTIVNAPTVEQLSTVRADVTVPEGADGGGENATTTGDTGGDATDEAETTTESDGPADNATVDASVATETTAETTTADA